MLFRSFLPGFLVMALYSGYIAGWALLNPEKTPPSDITLTFREKMRESKNLIPVTLLILLVFASLVFGWATATECAAWGVVGSLLIAWWSGMLSWKSFWDSVMGTVKVNAMIMLILAAASFLSAGMERWRDTVADLLMQATGARGLYERSDSGTRQLEGLEPRAGWLRGEGATEEIGRAHV